MIPQLTCFLVILVVNVVTRPNTLACEVATIEQGPYIVWVDGGKINDCIGILIHHEYVITLAECFEGDPAAIVYLRPDHANLPHLRKIIIEHSKKILFNDSLALVKLGRLVYINELVQKITLLTKSESQMFKYLSQTSTVEATLLSFISNYEIPFRIHLLGQNVCNFFYGINLSSRRKYCMRYDSFLDAKFLYKVGTPAAIGGKVFGLLLPPKKGLQGDMFRFVLSLEPFMDWIEKETHAFQDLQLQDQITCLEKRINGPIIAGIQEMKQELARALARISILEQKEKTNNVPTEDQFYFSGSGSGSYGNFSDWEDLF
ncbi:uncharacterized protein [Euwallacea fornicatus]|uniref:uncharacterized protein n=1 Tax=Euwallacea fornicatus TaxID=995702 RepID=UPI00338E7CCE